MVSVCHSYIVDLMILYINCPLLCSVSLQIATDKSIYINITVMSVSSRFISMSRQPFVYSKNIYHCDAICAHICAITPYMG